MANLNGPGFNNRASSLRFESGYGLFCSDSGFGGECRSFGPGEYGTLPAALNNAVTSGRRISNAYTYDQNPDWGS